ncbi:MAG TPA: hypothetical protein VMW54_04195 [Terriglobia bacterium]|nr:hypothetical protein [Terriglobia bacterium]
MSRSNLFRTLRVSALPSLIGISLLLASGCKKTQQETSVKKQTSPYKIWPSDPPARCPFQDSKDITGIGFTGEYAHYAHADTWYPTWAGNGNLYSPWTDGRVDGAHSNSAGPHATTGYATILGDNPLRLKVVNPGVYPGNPAPYGGRYPCGSLVYNGVWYYGTYCLMDSDGNPSKGLNWDILGPFVGFRYSTDYGQTWHNTTHTPIHPLFPEPKKPGGKLKIGSPHFVDFGKNMEYSPDGKAYLVGQGAVDPDPEPRPANLSWITGDRIYMVRVKPSIRNMNDRSKYEYFAGLDASGRAVWTRDFSKIQPLVDWNNNCGCVTMTYDAPLKRYLMCITDGGNTISRFNTYILESEQITGPWKMVAYMRHFGEQGYFVNIPSKFISKDGRTAWLCYAANFTNGYLHTNFLANPPGSGYGMTLHQIRLLGPGENQQRSPN